MIRSLLYVPANVERFVAKAHQRAADAIVLDLEDGVAPAQKDAARRALADAVPAAGRNGAMVFVRVNAGGGRFSEDAMAACRAGADGLFVPKVDDSGSLIALSELLDPVERALSRGPMRFVPMIETPGAVLDARPIASASPRVFGLIAGGEDLATAMDAEPTPKMLHLPKMLVHLAAKAAGVRSFGMLRSIADYRDAEGVLASAVEARILGFDGATCVHPDLVPLLNQGFSPSPEAVERARAIVSVFESAEAEGRGAVGLDGQMLDLPVVERARRLLARAER